MKHGSYSIEIQAIEPSGSWSNSFTLNLKIKPPFYLTYWFLSVVALVLSGIVYLIFRLRVQTLKREFELRRKIADDLHDNLSGKIYVLRALASRISQANNSKNETELKNQFENAGNSIMRTMRDILWTLDPSQDKISDLISRIETYASHFVQPVTERFFLVNDIAPDFPDKIGQTTKQELLYLLQETLANAVKHTRSKELTLSFTNGKHLLTVIVQNKFEVTANILPSSENGIGLESEKRRLSRLGGKVMRNRSLGEETVSFHIPL